MAPPGRGQERDMAPDELFTAAQPVGHGGQTDMVQVREICIVAI